MRKSVFDLRQRKIHSVMRKAKEKKRPAANKRRRNIALLIVALALLLLLLLRCSCVPPGLKPVPSPTPRPTPRVTIKTPKPKPARRSIRETHAPIHRGQFELGDDATEGWLEEFRLQAGARGGRLVGCLGTVSRGAIRWTAMVNRTTGETSLHQFESLGQTPMLSEEQHSCVAGVLSEPRFLIKKESPSPAGQNVKQGPVRVSLVFEL